jgi:hypothetical protein
MGIIRGDAGLCRGDVEFRKEDWVIRGVDVVFRRVIGEENGTEASWVIGLDPVVPNPAEIGVAEWVGSEPGGGVECADFRVESDVLGDLSNVYCGVYGIVDLV